MSKRKVVNSEGRAIIAKVFHFLKEEYNFMKANNIDKCDLSPLANVLKRTAAATGVGERTVTRILKEEKNLPSPSAKFTSPMKKRRKRDRKFKLDNMNREIIRTTIQHFHTEQKEIPTFAKLQSILREKIGFDGCLSTLRTLLIEMGYKWEKNGDNRKLLQERHDIQLCRFKFLKKIRQYRSEGCPIVYTDETSVLTSHVRQNTCRLEKNDTSQKDMSFTKKLSTGSRFIIVHAGTSSGFIKNASLVYKAASTTGDYHSDMSFENYVKWLNEKLLPNLPEKSVIVTNNASYHNIRNSKIPTSNSCKNDMQMWLTENGIPFDERFRKIELYDLIKKNKECFVRFKIDDIIRSKGFDILRLPPYHPELNAIKNIWGILKNQIASKNVGQNTTEVQNLIFESLDSIENNIWFNTCKHVEKIEKEYMKYFDYDFESVINIGESSNSETNEFVSDSDSLHEEDYY